MTERDAEARILKSLLSDAVSEPTGKDLRVLTAYATCVARVEDCRERCAKDGVIVADAKGQPVQHPALAVERAAMEEMRSWNPIVDAVLQRLRRQFR